MNIKPYEIKTQEFVICALSVLSKQQEKNYNYILNSNIKDYILNVHSVMMDRPKKCINCEF